MGAEFIEVLLDLRYFIARDRIEQAQEIAGIYRGPYYTEIRDAVSRGPSPPYREADDILCIVGMLYGIPELAARANQIKDEDLAAELTKCLDLFYNRGYV